MFFSQDLCARYFTYTREGETHFVLFDDADTLQQKLQTGTRMGFSAAFLMYPEVRDLLPRLFPGPADVKSAVPDRYSTFQLINNSASCSCERPRTSCGA